MKRIIYEMQGLTWQARKKNQQDAILIKNKVIYEKGRYSSLDISTDKNAWCVAVADGISSQPNSDKAAIAVLEIINEYYKNNTADIRLSYIQEVLCSKLKAKSVIDSATTMALIRHSAEDEYNQIRIQSLGDSRVYYFSHQLQSWSILTKDDNFFNEMDISNFSEESIAVLNSGQELASIYDTLTGYFCANSIHEVDEKITQIHKVEPNDVLMVCTDGVFDAITHDEWPLIQINQSLKEWLKNFVEMLKPFAGDNISLVLVKATTD
ncbi:serine/threonine protein phosphatase [Acinetobacter cumulans]|jgi:PPM family protein phosphatase|uniref:Serine/threonine protein phosphatase n=2 Tax=Acinetobacter TaxID=469 RepID=A0ABX9U347_9GAMM|nr:MULTISPECIES: protein phosphatase 2C domain-containing protein [Acinetobacter]AYA01554.1 serine/threonine protein phosphatase [Acinetobacter sp. WCHAc010034]MDV2488370.1 protein phosphatase 2C domain-containing protein [Acinetobacter johnsonii]RLL36956.1 serine/threonine protein phosphatase [Acinetobacter cumulans]WEE41905.1 protein phosphatase 2C domain-containing protein [Acinetobacter sp. TAC-1]